MAYEIPKLDTNQPIVDEDGKPTPYMEDLIFQILEALRDIDNRLTAGGL